METPNVTLIICDGFGLSTEMQGNAVAQAETPTIDYLLANYPSLRLLAAGSEVGLDMGEPGNSEVGHLTLGTGQVLPQAFQLINGEIKSEAYKQNRVFQVAIEKARKTQGGVLHLVGLVSTGGVHGHIDHMLALLRFARERGVERVAVHAITDGRDTAPQAVLQEIVPVLEALKAFKFGVVATIGGRFFALDRDHHWDRTDAFYWAMQGKSAVTDVSYDAAVSTGYGRGESDETLQPATITDSLGAPIAPIKAGDTVIFTNYRPDRVRQLATRVLMTPLALTVVTMTDYFLGALPTTSEGSTMVLNAYPLPKPSGTLAQLLAKHRLSQLHIGESEKYAHVTYFFNGHQEVKRALEEWVLVPSVGVDSFDRAPAMSAEAITSAYVNAKLHHPADFTVVNFANMDMVGHTGNFNATMEAVKAVDTCLQTIIQLAESRQEWLILTADHGNAEMMLDPQTGGIHKEHTINPVPFIFVHPSLKQARMITKQQLAVMSEIGLLADVAPTILDLFGIAKPREMVGTSLLPRLGVQR